MNLDVLLAFFAACDRHVVKYAVAGNLAELMRGRVALTEQLEIAIRPDDAELIRATIAQVWPDSHITDCSNAVMRVLPPDTPFYIDVVACPVMTVELMRVRDVPVRVLSEGSALEARDLWSRPGFTLRQRLAALHTLTRELVPQHVIVGVRKYRSIEAADTDRDRWEQERVDRIRAARKK